MVVLFPFIITIFLILLCPVNRSPPNILLNLQFQEIYPLTKKPNPFDKMSDSRRSSVCPSPQSIRRGSTIQVSDIHQRRPSSVASGAASLNEDNIPDEYFDCVSQFEAIEPSPEELFISPRTRRRNFQKNKLVASIEGDEGYWLAEEALKEEGKRFRRASRSKMPKSAKFRDACPSSLTLDSDSSEL